MAGGAFSGVARMGGKMVSSVSSFIIGLAVLAFTAVALTVVVPYAALMAWHHDDMQTGADQATRFVKAEYRIGGAAWQGGTAVTADGFREGQAMTDKSLAKLPNEG